MVIIFIIIFIISVINLSNSFNQSELLNDYPNPRAKNNKLLGMILAYNLNHFDPLTNILSNYLSICESGWNPTVVIFTTSNISVNLSNYLISLSYCYYISSPLDIRIMKHDPSIGIGLGAEHRKYLAREINNYDFFIYHEDDIMVKLSHVVGYLQETKKLHLLLPETGLRDHCIGFQRYRHLPFVNGYTEADILEQNLLEEMPLFRHICIQNQPYILVEGNTHQAMWMFTKNQILNFQSKCNFLNYSSASREHMSSFSLYNYNGGCGLVKLLPGLQFNTFTVLHYYQQRHVSWTPVYLAYMNMMNGFHYYSDPKVREDVPDCWIPHVNKFNFASKNNSKIDEILSNNQKHYPDISNMTNAAAIVKNISINAVEYISAVNNTVK